MLFELLVLSEVCAFLMQVSLVHPHAVLQAAFELVWVFFGIPEVTMSWSYTYSFLDD